MIVLDSSPIIYLAKLRLLHKIKEIYVAKSVYREVVTHAKDWDESVYIDSVLAKVVRSPKKKRFSYVKGLSQADSDSLSLAKELQCMVIMDEKIGREVAKLYSIEHHGTIYLLFHLCKKRILTKKQFVVCIDTIIAEGFYVSAPLYAQIMRRL